MQSRLLLLANIVSLNVMWKGLQRVCNSSLPDHVDYLELAERVRFEPTVRITAQRLSRPPSQILTGGKVNSRWLQAPDLDLFLGFSLEMDSCSV